MEGGTEGPGVTVREGDGMEGGEGVEEKGWREEKDNKRGFGDAFGHQTYSYLTAHNNTHQRTPTSLVQHTGGRTEGPRPTGGWTHRWSTEGGKHRCSTEGGKHRCSTEGGKHRWSTEGWEHRWSREAGKHRWSTEGFPKLRVIYMHLLLSSKGRLLRNWQALHVCSNKC